MRAYLKIISAVCLSALISACAKDSDTPTTESMPFPFETQAQEYAPAAIEKSEFEAFNGNLNEKNFKIEVLPAEIGKYILSLKWDQSIETLQVRVNNGPTMIKRNLYEHTQKVDAGKSVKIYFSALNPNNEVVSAIDVDIETPIDLLIREPFHLKEDTEWKLGRLHILAGGQIMTNGAKLTIHADEIHHHQPEFTSVNMDMAKHSVVNLEGQEMNPWFHGAHSTIDIFSNRIIGGFSIYTQTSSVITYSDGPRANWPDFKIIVKEPDLGSISIVRKNISKHESSKSWTPVTNMKKKFLLDFYERQRK